MGSSDQKDERTREEIHERAPRKSLFVITKITELSGIHMKAAAIRRNIMDAIQRRDELQDEAPHAKFVIEEVLDEKS